MPLQATSGAASYDAFGGGSAAGGVANYIEDVFSTYLYTGNGSTQTITNGIDLSTKGGMVWAKSRAAGSHFLYDTARGVNKYLNSNSTDSQTTQADSLTAFNTTGFSIGNALFNDSAVNYASWTFREQPKFFDVVTYSGNSVSGRLISHSLNSAPGCIIVKCTNLAGTNWAVWHRSLATGYTLQLQGTNAAFNTKPQWFNSSTQGSSTTFEVGNDTDTNETGNTYVAYLFAHDAGGFGLTGTDNVISCGSYTGNGSTSGPTINLGYEPQWLLVKNATTVGNWFLMDNMRGIPMTGDTAILKPNSSAAEDNNQGHAIELNATGFQVTTSFTGTNGSGDTLIYIAIRRGPMKVPTTGTSVFSPIAYTGNSTSNTTVQNLTTNFSGDATIIRPRDAGNNPLVFDKLRGNTQGIYTSLTAAEENISTARPGQSVGFNNTQTVLTGQFTSQGNYNYLSTPLIGWNFSRAPSFFDEVCSAGTSSSNQARTHNLGAVPELIIVKDRSSGGANWTVYVSSIGQNGYLNLNTTGSTQTSSGVWGTTTNTSTTFYCNDTANWCAGAGNNGVFYLFATCPGVSKVGTYTGNGATQAIACGFTGGARFVLIKRTDSTGNWFVYDTARGMTTLTDPYLLLNSTAAESNTLGSVTTTTGGFTVDGTILGAINTNAATYIFLAIA